MQATFGLVLLASIIGRFGPSETSAAPKAPTCGVAAIDGCITDLKPQATSDEQQLAEKYSPITMLERQEQPCDRYGEPYLPAPVEVVFNDPEVELVQVTNRSRSSVELIKKGPSIADLA